MKRDYFKNFIIQIMPPNVSYGTSHVMVAPGEKPPRESVLMQRSSNRVDRELQSVRAYEVLRAGGGSFTVGRALVKITCVKGCNVCKYV